LSGFFGELYLRSTRPFLTGDRTAREVAYLTRMLPPGGRVLDVGCGHGRHAGPLARAGARIVGVDFDPLSLGEREPGFLAVRADFRHPPFQRVFDGAYSWYSTLFIGSDAENAAALRAVATCLRPGGTLILHTVPFAWFEQNPRASYRGKLPDGSWLEEENVFDPTTGRDVGVRRLRLPDGRELTGDYAIRTYPVDELQRLADDCGFSWSWAHGNLEGHPLERSSSDLIVGLLRT
jgi:SAM-dependent methyltransferase